MVFDIALAAAAISNKAARLGGRVGRNPIPRRFRFENRRRRAAERALLVDILASLREHSAARELDMAPLPDPRAPCPDPSRHAREVDLARMLKPGYWRKLCPDLHVGDRAWQDSVRPMRASAEVAADARERILTDGFVKVPASRLPWRSVNHRALAAAAATLMQHGWNPSWLLMYDEAWAVARELSDLVEAATGNRLNFDALCWHVDPRDARPTAFSPHRDRQPDDSPATFRPDGTAMYATAWVPLTDAHAENSCLHFIPRDADPGYYDGDDDDPDADADPLQLCLPNKEAYQHITAVPAETGSAVLFTHRVIHWGGRGRGAPESFGERTEPRVCVSFGFADDAFEPAYVDRTDNLPFPPVGRRAALIAAQMIAYHERFPASARALRLFHDATEAEAAAMDPAYRKKVVFEFTRAAAAGRGKGMPPGSERDNSLVGGGRKRKEAERDDPSEDTFEDEGDVDDDAMERALEAMIDAKMGGDGDDFRDDFDDADEGVDAEEPTGLAARGGTPRKGEKRRKRGSTFSPGY